MQRHVDLWTALVAVHSIHRPAPWTRDEALVPGWGRGPRRNRLPESVGGRQRQRIDMISPATMAPNPMAKFHADSDIMNGIRSPAT